MAVARTIWKKKRQNQRQMQFAVMPTLDQVPTTAHQLIAPTGLVWLAFGCAFGFDLEWVRPARGRFVGGFRWVFIGGGGA